MNKPQQTNISSFGQANPAPTANGNAMCRKSRLTKRAKDCFAEGEMMINVLPAFDLMSGY